MKAEAGVGGKVEAAIGDEQAYKSSCVSREKKI